MQIFRCGILNACAEISLAQLGEPTGIDPVAATFANFRDHRPWRAICLLTGWTGGNAPGYVM